MKFTIKTLILVVCLVFALAILIHLSNKNEYEILKPVVVTSSADSSSWQIIMGVKKNVFINIEKHWKKKHTNERK